MIDLAHYNPVKARWLTKMSNIPNRFLGVEFEDLQVKVPFEIQDWLDMVLEGKVIKQIGGLGITGKGLLFDGLPGRGKTTLAVLAATTIIYRLPDEDIQKVFQYDTNFIKARPVYYLTYPEYLTKKKASFSAEGTDKTRLEEELEGFHGRAKDDSLNVRILVLDDLGKEYGSVYDNAAFDEILRSRYDRALPTIVTTNVVLEKWESVYKSAMASFANEAFVRVPVTGDDLRGAQ